MQDAASDWEADSTLEWAADSAPDWAAEPTPVETHDGIPIRGYNRGEPIPDLGRIPQDRWREVLRPLRGLTRKLALNSAPSESMRDAMALVG